MTDPVNSSDLHARLLRLQVQCRLPSIIAGVVRDGELVDTAAVSSGAGTDLECAYRIGSITKTFTAVLVMQLREEGRLDLDDPIGRFVPETGYAATTIGDLLGHTGGMQSEPAGPWWERSAGGDFDALVTANDGSGAVAGPGKYFHYSNLGYALLGELVARERGRAWWDVVVERLLDPLGMRRTTYAPVAPHAQGYSVEHFTGRLAPEPHTDTGAMAPAGQAWSTIDDLATWTTVLAGRRPEILGAATAAEMAADRLGAGYGLGLRLLDVAGRTWVGHTGSMPGFLASLFVEPVSGDATIALANATTGLSCDAVPADLTTAADPGPAPSEEWRPTQDVPSEALGALGLWFWGNTAIEHRWENGGLEQRHLQSGRPGSRFEVHGGRLVGVRGYHRGETMQIVASSDDPAGVSHLVCATFVHTRVPYDPAIE
ncbi:serine hydrolase domain-containing protein [soil metagenome]